MKGTDGVLMDAVVLEKLNTEPFVNPISDFQLCDDSSLNNTEVFDLQNKVIPYFLDLLEFRNVSNEIASRFGVTHQSPQIILVKDGKSVYNASHESIDISKLAQFV